MDILIKSMKFYLFFDTVRTLYNDDPQIRVDRGQILSTCCMLGTVLSLGHKIMNECTIEVDSLL